MISLRPASFFVPVLSSLLLVPPAASAAFPLVPLREPQLWQMAEWRIEQLPAAENPFDPDVIRVDAEIITPSGRQLLVPAFWHQSYTRALEDGAQQLKAAGDAEWRLRFTADEPGEYRLRLQVQLGASPVVSTPDNTFTIVDAPPSAQHGWVQRGDDPHFLITSDDRPLRLIGANVCWGGARATYDYDDWFPAMRDAGENFARLWFAPWSMGIEHTPGTLNRYDLAEAWEVDHVIQLAEQCGLYFLIAADHHGMFMANDPAWGGSNNFWTRSSPYAIENGGPCADPNEFFTNPAARRLYQKRLRYMIARWGYSPRLLSWQFFNEIDNAYRPRSALVHEDVVAWHREMGQWLRANDPYRHLISTSLTGASDRPDFWSLPEMDFAVYHSYGEADPARYLASLAAGMVERYRKPVMIGEIGTNHLGWNIANDPYLRGFRQGLWGGTLGGSLGTAMAWWWEDIHADNAYPLFTVVRDLMLRAGWDEGTWTPATFAEQAPPPLDPGELMAGGEPFDADIPLNQLRLNPVSGQAAITSPLAAARAAERISSYLHGTRNPQLQQHARFTAWFGTGARLIFRVNSVAADAELFVLVDDKVAVSATLANADGIATLNDEINREFAVQLPAGKHTVEIAHTGEDWVNLKSIRLERILPATFADGWTFEVDAIGMQHGETVVVYARSPHVAWPAGARRYNPPVISGAAVTLTTWPARRGTIEWFDPRDGRLIATMSVSAETGSCRLPLPDFNDDLVGILRGAPTR